MLTCTTAIMLACVWIQNNMQGFYQNSEYDQEIPNHKLQTNPWHREEQPHNNHETPGRQTKQRSQFILPHQDDCKTRMDTKQRTTKLSTTTVSHNESNNQQRINNNRNHRLRTDSSLSHWGRCGA